MARGKENFDPTSLTQELKSFKKRIQELNETRKKKLEQAIGEQENRFDEYLQTIKEANKRIQEFQVVMLKSLKKHLQEEKASNRRIKIKESEELKKRIHIWPYSVRSIKIGDFGNQNISFGKISFCQTFLAEDHILQKTLFVDEKHNSFCLVEFLTKPTCDNNYKVKIFDVRWASGVIDICLP